MTIKMYRITYRFGSSAYTGPWKTNQKTILDEVRRRQRVGATSAAMETKTFRSLWGLVVLTPQEAGTQSFKFLRRKISRLKRVGEIVRGTASVAGHHVPVWTSWATLSETSFWRLGDGPAPQTIPTPVVASLPLEVVP